MNYILVNEASWLLPDREFLFRNVSFSVGRGEKMALVGDNGSGKSTLLRILAGELRSASGEVALASAPYYIPQHFGQYDHTTVAGALGIGAKLQALHAILGGDVSPEHYNVLGDDWAIEERALAALAAWDLEGFALDRAMSSLSGGEKTRVFLAGAALHDPQIVLLDEPSNHLDTDARERLYAWVRDSRAAMVVVSHDRTLLNLLDTTCELTPAGLVAYGGNYDFYEQQRDARLEALAGDLHEKQKALRAARGVARQAAERKQRADARGEAKQAARGVARIMMRTLKDSAEASASRLKDVHAEKIDALTGELREIRSRIPAARELKVKFDDPALHRGKTLVAARDLNFGYGGELLWSEPLSFEIFSGDRIALQGANGSGKTTLIKLILGELQPSHGTIVRAGFSSLYIDQEYSLVDNSLTVYAQAARYNTRNLPESEVKTELHRFLLPAASWDKPCGVLSGGEKMKLIFCCLVLGNASPDVLILDEPTNNLDIRSLEIVASALRGYRGTLVVISHDRRFLDDVGIGSEISLPVRNR